jgi:hypothetical protein
MNKLLMIVMFVIATSCGKSATEMTTNSNGFQSSPIQGMTAVLFIPAPTLQGGSISLNINGQNYPVNFNSSSQQATQYIVAISQNQIMVQPYRVDNFGRYYRVNYQGSTAITTCPPPASPTAQCNTVAVQAISIY